MSNINKRYDSLKQIYKVLGETQILNEGEIVNYDEILKNLYHLNLLLFKTYKIFSSKVGKKKMINMIADLRDVDGNTFLTKDISEKLIDLYKNRIIEFFEKIHNRIVKHQKGGYEREEYFSNNMVNDYIYDYLKKYGIDKNASITDIISIIQNLSPISIQVLFRGMPIDKAKLLKISSPDDVLKMIEDYYPLQLIVNMRKYAKILSVTELQKRAEKYDNWIQENQELVDMVKQGLIIGPKGLYKVGGYIFDWVFFPLYNLENLPIVGTLFEIPFDIMGIVIDNSGIIMEPLSIIIPKGLDILTDVGSAIPVPGVNTAIAAVGLGITLADKPLTYLIANGPDIFGLFLNVQRKQWGLAYSSLLEVIPGFAAIMDAAVTNMYTANKYAYKGVRFTDFFKETLITTRSLAKPFLLTPQIMFQPKGIWNKVVYPNRQRLPIIRNIPFETIEKNMILLKSMYDKGVNIYNKGKDTYEKGLFDPNEVMNEFIEAKKGQLQDKADKAVKTVTDKVEKAQEKAQEKVQEKVDKTVKTVTDKVEKAQEKAQEKVDKTVKTVTDKVEKAQEKAQEKVDKTVKTVTDKVEETQTKVQEKVQEKVHKSATNIAKSTKPRKR